MSKTDAVSAWKKNKRHEITLPSGTKVKIEVPNLRLLIKSGQIPNSLIEAATKAAAGGANSAPTPEMLEQQEQFYAKLVVVTVKEPEITEEDVVDLPFEDIELLADIATRQTNIDGAGNHIGGIVLTDEYAGFRS